MGDRPRIAEENERACQVAAFESCNRARRAAEDEVTALRATLDREQDAHSRQVCALREGLATLRAEVERLTLEREGIMRELNRRADDARAFWGERDAAREDAKALAEALTLARSALDRLMGDTDPADPEDPDLLAMQTVCAALSRHREREPAPAPSTETKPGPGKEG